MKKYTDEDLENLIAICDQDEEDPKRAALLKQRCERALAYTYAHMRITIADIEFLKKRYDTEMNQSARQTLDKILLDRKNHIVREKEDTAETINK